MSASKHLKLLSVRLSAADLRHFKSVAATRGVSLQEAARQALEAWSSAGPKSSVESLYALQGSLGDVDFEKLRRDERRAELAKDQRWS